MLIQYNKYNIVEAMYRGIGWDENRYKYDGDSPLKPVPDKRGLVFDSTRDQMKIRYIIVSEAMYGRTILDKNRYKIENTFYDQVSTYPLIKEFKRSTGKDSSVLLFAPTPYPLEPYNLYQQVNMIINNLIFRNQSLRGPTIKIYQIPNPAFQG